METADNKLKQIRESLHRIDMGLRSFIVNHREMFDLKTYQQWEIQNPIENPEKHDE